MFSCFQELQVTVPCDVTSQKTEFGFVDNLSTFACVVCLLITMGIMLITPEVVNLLQEKEIDIVKNMHLITALHEFVKTKRAEVGHYHYQYHDETLQLAIDITDQSNILVVGEIPGASTRDYNITIPMLDHLAICVQSTFTEKITSQYRC